MAGRTPPGSRSRPAIPKLDRPPCRSAGRRIGPACPYPPIASSASPRSGGAAGAGEVRSSRALVGVMSDAALVGPRVQDQPRDLLHVIALRDELPRQGVQQRRVGGRLLTRKSSTAQRCPGRNSRPRSGLPRRAANSRLSPRGQPLGQGRAPIRLAGDCRRGPAQELRGPSAFCLGWVTSPPCGRRPALPELRAALPAHPREEGREGVVVVLRPASNGWLWHLAHWSRTPRNSAPSFPPAPRGLATRK